MGPCSAFGTISAMDSDVKAFIAAVHEGDETYVNSLLSSGSVAAKSRFPTECGDYFHPVLVPVMRHFRATVLRSLVEHGADLDEFHTISDGLQVTAVGGAIASDIPDMAILAIRLGASYSSVYKAYPEATALLSRVHRIFSRSKCLGALLDELFAVRRIQIDEWVLSFLAAGARNERITIETYKELAKRDFNFKVMESTIVVSNNCAMRLRVPEATKSAEFMLSCALKTGNAILVGYIIKTLGLMSDMECIRTTGESKFVTERSRSMDSEKMTT